MRATLYITQVIITILKENLKKIIEAWENTYPEFKEELSKWKDVNINGKWDLVQPIISYQPKDKKVECVRLEIHATLGSNKISYAEFCTIRV